jgi:S1-C subfamily serine protease
MTNLFCSNCGRKANTDDVYCASCGNKMRSGGPSGNPKVGTFARSWLQWALLATLVVAVGFYLAAAQNPTPTSPTSTAGVQSPSTLRPETPSTAPATTSDEQLSFTDSQLAERFGDAVFRVEVSGCGVFGSGSAFAIDDHHLVTNQHVVNEDTEPTLVHRDGTRLQGRVIGWEIDPDVAVIEVSASLPTVLNWAPTSTLTVGDRVIGLGYPVPETDFAAIGGSIISFDEHLGVRRALRTDASWDHGNSGGPAITTTGEIAGVITQFAENEGGRQDVLLAFTATALEETVAGIISNPTDVVSGCAGSGTAQYEPGYIEGLDDYYPDPSNPFWTAILMSVDYLTEDPNKAFDKAYETLGLGLPVGLLISDDFPSLRPGYIVVYSGRFATADEAKLWCEQITGMVGSCYHRNVGWDSSYR